jgi:hypothetical protein
MATMVRKEAQEVVTGITLAVLDRNLLLAEMVEQVAPVQLVLLAAQPTAAHHHPTLAHLGLEETVVEVVQVVKAEDSLVGIVLSMALQEAVTQH